MALRGFKRDSLDVLGEGHTNEAREAIIRQQRIFTQALSLDLLILDASPFLEFSA